MILPNLTDPLILGIALTSLFGVTAIGLWASSQTQTVSDFYVAGRRLGLWMTALATMSSAFSAFVFLGGPGLMVRLGTGSLFICLPLGYTAALLSLNLGRPLASLASQHGVLTIPDALEYRYRSRWVRGLAAVAIVVGSVAYLGAQFRALGFLLDALFDFTPLFGTGSWLVSLLLGVLVVTLYSAAGGMLAGVYTDVVQGLLMVFAALGVFWVAMTSFGNLSELFNHVAADPRFGPSFLDPFGRVGVTTTMSFFLVFGVGVLGQPHMLHKFFMMRDRRVLKWLPLVVGGSQSLCFLIWIGIGLAVPALLSAGLMMPLESPDQAAPQFLLQFTPSPLAGLAVAGVLAAIMSTADSFLNITAAALVRDLPLAFGRPASSRIRTGRWMVIVVSGLATGVAVVWGDLIALLGTFAFGTFAAALTPSLAIGFHWRKASKNAAIASISVGLILNLGLEWLSRQQIFPNPLPEGVLASATALVISTLVFLGVGTLSHRD